MYKKLIKKQDYVILLLCLTSEILVKYSFDPNLATFEQKLFHLLWMLVLYLNIFYLLRTEKVHPYAKNLFFIQFTTPLLLSIVIPEMTVIALLSIPWVIIIKMKFILCQDTSLGVLDWLLFLNLIIGILMLMGEGPEHFTAHGHLFYTEFINSFITLTFAFLIFRSYLKKLRGAILNYRETEWHHKWYLSLLLHLGHNLRTPLSAVMTNLDVLEFKMPKDPILNSTIDRIKLGGSKLNDTVNSLIHSSNSSLITKNGKSITQVVEHFISIVDQPIAFTSQNNEPVIIKGPEIVSLLMALELLLRNAVEYGEPPIRIKVKGNTITFRDSGVGLPEVLKQKLMDESSSFNATGYGNSLKFVFTLLKESGWQIQILRSTKGASFKIKRGIRSWAEKAIS